MCGHQIARHIVLKIAYFSDPLNNRWILQMQPCKNMSRTFQQAFITKISTWNHQSTANRAGITELYLKQEI